MSSRALIVVFASSLLLGGCGACVEAATQAAIEKATGVEVDKDGERITFKGKDGEKIEFQADGKTGSLRMQGKEGTVEFNADGEGKLPSGFPLSVASGAKVEGSLSTNTDKERTYIATLRHQGDIQKVSAFYQRELESKGFDVERAEMEFNGRRSITLSGKADARQASVTLHSDDEDGFLTQISWREPK